MSLFNPYMFGRIDDYVTGGADPYGDEEPECCCNCGKVIRIGDTYYDIGGHLYCMDMGCTDAADEAILASEREKYLWEME